MWTQKFPDFESSWQTRYRSVVLLLTLRNCELSVLFNRSDEDVETRHHVELGAGYGSLFFLKLLSGVEKQEVYSTSLADSITLGNMVIPALSSPVTGSTNGELGQGLGWLCFAKLNTSMSAVCH